MKRLISCFIAGCCMLPFVASAAGFSTAGSPEIELSYGICGVYNSYSPCKACCEADAKLDQKLLFLADLACKVITEKWFKAPTCILALAISGTSDQCTSWNCKGKKGTPCALKPGWTCGDCGLAGGTLDPTCGPSMACCPPECEDDPGCSDD